MNPNFTEARDAEGEPTLWFRLTEGDPTPQPIIRRCDLSPQTRDMWPVIVERVLEWGPL